MQNQPPSRFLDASFSPGSGSPVGGGAPSQRGLPPPPPSTPQYTGGLGGMSNPGAAAGNTLDRTKGAGTTSGAPGAPGPEDWLAMLHQFYEEMNRPLDLEDPLVKNILTGARTSTLSSMQGQGVYGGYSQGAAEKSYIGTAAGLQQQRQQMGAQALQSGVGASQDLAKMRYGQARDSYQDMLANYSRQNEQNQGLGATIGGGIGGVVGGVGGFFLGGPAGAVAGAKGGFDAGSSIGRGIGGMGQPPPPQFSYRGYGGHV